MRQPGIERGNRDARKTKKQKDGTPKEFHGQAQKSQKWAQ
jgi:hypothetical protein